MGRSQGKLGAADGGPNAQMQRRDEPPTPVGCGSTNGELRCRCKHLPSANADQVDFGPACLLGEQGM